MSDNTLICTYHDILLVAKNMKRVHLILTGLTLSIILLSVNRLTMATQAYMQPFEFLRFMDFFAMIPIPLISVLLYVLLKEQITKSTHIGYTLILITGIYLFAAGSGDHEVTNYLNMRFCDSGKTTTPICRIISYNDDEFSHYVYYAGFILLNIGLMLYEYTYPRLKRITGKDIAGIAANSFLIGLGIFANLAFEDIGIDLYIFGAVMILSLYLLYKGKQPATHLPVTMYFAIAYTLGVTATLLVASFT